MVFLRNLKRTLFAETLILTTALTEGGEILLFTTFTWQLFA